MHLSYILSQHISSNISKRPHLRYRSRNDALNYAWLILKSGQSQPGIRGTENRPPGSHPSSLEICLRVCSPWTSQSCTVALNVIEFFIVADSLQWASGPYTSHQFRWSSAHFSAHNSTDWIPSAAIARSIHQRPWTLQFSAIFLRA